MFQKYKRIAIQSLGIGLAFVGLFSFAFNVSTPYHAWWCWGGLVALFIGIVIIAFAVLDDDDIYGGGL